MEWTTVEGLPHIQPVSYRFPHLQSVTASPFGSSETKAINAVTIPLKDMGVGVGVGVGEGMGEGAEGASGSLVLCDCPGFGEGV